MEPRSGIARVTRRRATLLGVSALIAACGGGGGGGGTDDPQGTAPPPPPAGPAPAPGPAAPPGSPATAPQILRQPQPRTVPEGATATFDIDVANMAEVTYQWLRNGSPVPGATQASYTTASLTPADTGSTWSVRVSGPGGTVLSDEVALMVTPAPAYVVKNQGLLDDIPALISGVSFAATADGSIYYAFNEGVAVMARKRTPEGTSGSYAPGMSELRFPWGDELGTSVIVAPDGALYISAESATCSAGPPRSCTATGTYSLYRVSSSGQRLPMGEWQRGTAGALKPVALTLAPDGTLYFMDDLSGNILRWDPSGTPTVVFKLTRFADQIPQLAVGPDGTVYVLLAQTLQRHAGGRLVEMGSFPTLPRTVSPILAVDAAGSVFVSQGEVIWRVPANEPPILVAGLSGVRDLSSRDALGTIATLASSQPGVLHAISWHRGAFESPRALLRVELR